MHVLDEVGAPKALSLAYVIKPMLIAEATTDEWKLWEIWSKLRKMTQACMKYSKLYFM